MPLILVDNANLINLLHIVLTNQRTIDMIWKALPHMKNLLLNAFYKSNNYFKGDKFWKMFNIINK